MCPWGIIDGLAFIFCYTVVIDAEQDVCCSPVVSKLRNYVTAVKCWLYTMYGFLTWRWKEENARWECIDRGFRKKTHKGAPSHAQKCGSTLPTQERQLQKDADSCLFSCPTLKLFHGFPITFKLMRWTGQISQNQREDQLNELRWPPPSVICCVSRWLRPSYRSTRH